MTEHFRRDCAALHHAGIRRQITAQYGDTAGFAVRILHRTDNLRIFVHAVFDVFAHCFAGAGHAFRVQQAKPVNFMHDGVYAARLV